MAVATGAHRRPRRPQGPASPRAAPPGQTGGCLRGRVFPRQIRAYQRDFFCRLRAASPAVLRGPHDDVSDRALVRFHAAAVDSPAADRDASARRNRFGIQELCRRVGNAGTGSFIRGQDERGTVAGIAHQAHSPHPGAQIRPPRRCPGHDAGAGRGSPSGHSVLAPRSDQFPPSPAAAGAGDPGYARPQCDRNRTRAHAQSASERARGALHSCGRRRRDEDRHRRLAKSSRRRQSGHQGRPPGNPQQDRRAMGRAQDKRRSRVGDRAPGSHQRTIARAATGASLSGFGAKGPPGEDQRR